MLTVTLCVFLDLNVNFTHTRTHNLQVTVYFMSISIYVTFHGVLLHNALIFFGIRVTLSLSLLLTCQLSTCAHQQLLPVSQRVVLTQLWACKLVSRDHSAREQSSFVGPPNHQGPPINILILRTLNVYICLLRMWIRIDLIRRILPSSWSEQSIILMFTYSIMIKLPIAIGQYEQGLQWKITLKCVEAHTTPDCA